MRKNYKTIKTSLIIGIVLLCLIAPYASASARLRDDRPKLLSFNSYFDIIIDEDKLNDEIDIDTSLNVPLEIRYWTDVPKDFLRFMPWQIKNLILFGTVIVPSQRIHVEVVNAPDWANIFIASPDMFVNIPTGTQVVNISNTLVLSPKEEAPSESYTFTLKLTADTIGRVNGREYIKDTDFVPSFVPSISVNVDNPTRKAGPRATVEFVITVENKAYKKTQVTPNFDLDDKWTTTINPSQHDIDPGETEQFVFSVVTPFDFGWHDEIKFFKIDFEAKVFPIRTGSATEVEPTYLIVNNYGFSTPGFEIITLIGAIIIISLLMKKRQEKK